MKQKSNRQKNIERFSHTVDYYSKYRPTYPKSLIDFLINKQVITKNSIIADIGSGTGIFTRCLLETGATVFAVEPNQAMRIAGENYLKRLEKF